MRHQFGGAEFEPQRRGVVVKVWAVARRELERLVARWQGAPRVSGSDLRGLHVLRQYGAGIQTRLAV